MPEIGFVGLGLMGSAMTKNLLAAGYQVHGFDTDARSCQRLVDRGGTIADSPAEAARGLDVVMLSLPHGGIVTEVCFGDAGLVETLSPGAVVVDATTAQPHESRATAERLRLSNIRYLDCTVSGTSAMAEHRDLIAIVGGDKAAYDEVGPVLDAITRARYHLGPVGAGTQTKLVVNLLLGLNRLALAETLTLGQKAGMDLPVLLEVLKDSVASRVTEIYGEKMVHSRHLPPTGRIRSHTKDIRLATQLADEVGMPLQLTPVLAEVLVRADEMGLAEWGSTATIEVLRDLAGIERVIPEEQS